ncbi:MAG: 4Fe-4S binding protein [Victivallaceae bacterium]|nr:4Fe-4S binding protein [Victivallaceae bacterium]
MKRKIIAIDEEKCNGCGQCIPNCPEGALQVIDGKARLVSDLFCDGLGACIGECPLGAITVVEREAEPYDERKVMANIVRMGANTIAAHLRHLRSHGEFKLLESAVGYLKENQIPVPDFEPEKKLPCGCPGSLARKLKHDMPAAADVAPKAGDETTELRQWPVQLRLLNPDADYFDGADLLVAADCVAYTRGGFHGEFLRGRILAVFCPKLDANLNEYAEKLTAIFARHNIHSVTVVKMEVPCCGGTEAIVKRALEKSGRTIPLKVITVGIDGTLK